MTDPCKTLDFSGAHDDRDPVGMNNNDTLTLLREVEAALVDIGKRGEIPFTSHKWLFYCQDVAKKTLPAIQELMRRASVIPQPPQAKGAGE